MRPLALLVFGAALAAAAPAPEPAREMVQAVEFPYYAYPRQYWERELVWLKNIGIDTVEFSIPWNWHQPDPSAPDLTGRTSPRRDVMGLLRLLRRLDMRAWIRPQPPVRGWLNAGYPMWAGQDRRAARVWLRELESQLMPLTTGHGGPIAFVEAPGFNAPYPPGPVMAISATHPAALSRSRHALETGRGSLLWEDVEDAVYPVGWESAGAPIFSAGAVSLAGREGAGVAALRRDAALVRHWAPLLAGMRRAPHPVRSVAGKFPEGISAFQLIAPESRSASAMAVINDSAQPFRGDLRVYYPATRHSLVLPNVSVPAQDALWLPVNVALAASGLCHGCSVFSNAEHVVYATAELQTIEFENGILAMEFSAPVAGEVVLQLSREPVGPYLAAGHPVKFDWDGGAQRARLPIPAGKGPGNRVRVGLAIQAPDSSAFFVEAHRLIIGRTNRISTSYSSAELAQRSRLLLPEDFTARALPKSPTEIDYDVEVPASELHGDFADLAIEADGVTLGRARLQMFRPVSIRTPDGIKLHYGGEELPVDPLLIPSDAHTGRNVDFVLRNNVPEIQTYTLSPSGAGLKFLPEKSELSVGAVMERTARLRVFPDDGTAGLTEWRLAVSGAAQMTVPARLALIPRGQTVVYSADLDGDGAPEYVLENQKARAVFSAQDGGRWLEYVWKDSDTDVLPPGGALAGAGPVGVRIDGNALVLVSGDWTRTIRLDSREARLVVEQNTPLPAETLPGGKVNEVTFEVHRESATRAVYSLRK